MELSSQFNRLICKDVRIILIRYPVPRLEQNSVPLLRSVYYSVTDLSKKLTYPVGLPLIVKNSNSQNNKQCNITGTRQLHKTFEIKRLILFKAVSSIQSLNFN